MVAAAFGTIAIATAFAIAAHAEEPSVEATRQEAAQWRAERRIIDLHMHIPAEEERLQRATKIMDAAGIGIGANLSGDITVLKIGRTPPFQKNKEATDALMPRRFVYYMNLDYSGWDDPDFSERAVRQIEEGYRLGAAGLKEYKRLGLYLRDGSGALIKIDDPKLDPVWKRCGELGMPVSIHVADPKAFWEPYDPGNERWVELKDHKSAIRKNTRAARRCSTRATAWSSAIRKRPSSASTSPTIRRTSIGWTSRSTATRT